MSPAVELTAYDAVILDFDGPMCNVFAGYPATAIADELKQLLVDSGWRSQALPNSTDPHQIVRLVHRLAPALSPRIESALSAAESTAVESATETPGLRQLLEHLADRQIPVAIASNNSPLAIRQWLATKGYSTPLVLVASLLTRRA